MKDLTGRKPSDRLRKKDLFCETQPAPSSGRSTLLDKSEASTAKSYFPLTRQIAQYSSPGKKIFFLPYGFTTSYISSKM